MRHRALARPGATSPTAVTAVPDDVAFNTLRGGLAPDHGQIMPLHRVSSKLCSEAVFGQPAESEYHQTASFFVQTVDSANRFSQVRRKVFLERVQEGFWQVAAGTRPEFRGLIWMPHGCQPGRFLHDEHVTVLVTNGDRPCTPGRVALSAGRHKNTDSLAGMDATRRVKAGPAIDLDPAFANEIANAASGH